MTWATDRRLDYIDPAEIEALSRELMEGGTCPLRDADVRARAALMIARLELALLCGFVPNFDDLS
jgi:hypothetical protein